MAKDYYDILGVHRDASDEDIKRAFRKLAQKYHPDKTGGDDAKFKEINSAYQALSDPEKRKKYDQFGDQFEQMGGGSGGSGAGFGGFDFSQGGFQFDFNDINDMFGGAFGGGRGGRQRQVQGRNIEMDISLTFLEAVFGVEKSVHVYKTVSCRDCKGSGGEPGSAIKECTQCHGAGQIRQLQQTVFGSFQTAATCPRCAGVGKTPEKKCRRCDGGGVARENKAIDIKIPAGINNGDTLRVAGEGEAVAHGHNGDLFVHARVKNDPRFVREDFAIKSQVAISMARAALGGTVDVETVDGTVELKIPPGTQPSHVFRLKARGVPHLKTNGRGDHFVEIIVTIPERLTKEQKRVLEEWEKER